MGFIYLNIPEDLSLNLDLQALIQLFYLKAHKSNTKVKSWVRLGFSCPQ